MDARDDNRGIQYVAISSIPPNVGLTGFPFFIILPLSQPLP